MPAFSHMNTPSTRMPQDQKWTVSPEFGDALMTAMRIRTESGGPIPRLPSLLQLPGSDPISKPSSAPETGPDNTKLTMKTRVAIRDKTPHRFQVVPLREISSLALPARDVNSSSKAQRGVLHTKNKPRLLGAGGTSASATAQVQGRKPIACTELPERTRTLDVINENVPDLEKPCSVQHSSLKVSNLPEEQWIPGHRTSSTPATKQAQNHPITTHRSSMPARSILRSKHGEKNEHPHFKSPSLGDLRETPPFSRQLGYATLPRVGHHKRTNTLSVDNSLEDDLAVYEETKILERRRPLEHNALKRHAIYTQSLYVPHDERRRMSSAVNSYNPPFTDTGEDVTDLNPRKSQKSGSSFLSDNHSPSLSLQQATSFGNYALDLADTLHIPKSIFSSTSHIHGFSSDSQSSLSSIYSQDGFSLNSQSSQATLTQTRPLTQSRLSSGYQLSVKRQTCTEDTGKGTIVHHPIITELLAEVNEALQEWRSI